MRRETFSATVRSRYVDILSIVVMMTSAARRMKSARGLERLLPSLYPMQSTPTRRPSLRTP